MKKLIPSGETSTSPSLYSNMANQGRGISQARERLDKINELWDTIKACKKKGAIKKVLVADFCLNYGAQRRTVLEYIQLLLDAGKIREEEGRLYQSL